MAGFYAASAEVYDSTCAFVVGPHAQETADGMCQVRPIRMIAVAQGPVRKDLQERGNGVYIVSNEGAIGPMSANDALLKLSLFYKVFGAERKR